jgi:hypothetical protein
VSVRCQYPAKDVGCPIFKRHGGPPNAGPSGEGIQIYGIIFKSNLVRAERFLKVERRRLIPRQERKNEFDCSLYSLYGISGNISHLLPEVDFMTHIVDIG